MSIAGWLVILALGVSVAADRATAATNATVLASSLTLPQCIELAVRQNPEVRKAREELRRAQGVIVETRAEALPNVRAVGEYRERARSAIDTFPGATGSFENQERPWNADVEVTQLIYSGGRVRAALRAARLADQAAVLAFDQTVADTILAVREVFYEVLLNAELVGVREKSIILLQRQLEDVRHRLDVGAVPQFNLLRAEVELANAQPPLIRARNALRLAKENLVKLLALDEPGSVREFTAVQFAGDLGHTPQEWAIDKALAAALANRPEIQAAEKQVALRRENLTVARAGYHPELSAFAGYGVRNSLFSNDLDDTRDGWNVGARVSWDIFDGMRTKGQVAQARAELASSEIDYDDTRRTVELEVRRSYSEYQQAVELVAAQAKTVEQAEESVRLAEARFRAGTGTQLDVLSAQTALTEARSNKVQALYDFNVAVARLERATGLTVRHAD